MVRLGVFLWSLVASVRATTPKPIRLTGKGRLTNVSFLRIPRTGSTFVYTLFRGACRFATTPMYSPHRMMQFINERCPRAFRVFDNGHRPLASSLEPSVAYIAVLRKPWKRVRSGLYHGFQDCSQMQASLNVTPVSSIETAHALEYADCAGSCHVHMLTGLRCGTRWNSFKHNTSYVRRTAREEARAKTAIERLDQFTFVGIADHWEAMLMLFASRFDLPIVAADRATINRQEYPMHDWISELLASLSYVDDELYDRGLQTFARDIARLVSVLPHPARPTSAALDHLRGVLSEANVTQLDAGTNQTAAARRDFPGVRFIIRYTSGLLNLP